MSQLRKKKVMIHINSLSKLLRRYDLSVDLWIRAFKNFCLGESGSPPYRRNRPSWLPKPFFFSEQKEIDHEKKMFFFSRRKLIFSKASIIARKRNSLQNLSLCLSKALAAMSSVDSLISFGIPML